MNLEFKLFIIDDNPDGVKQATEVLREYLKDNGFSLQPEYMDFSADLHDRQGVAKGKKCDLAMVDYNLGSEETGADMAQKLRTEMRYTDIVFYSAQPEVDLLKELADKRVAGVFVATRTQLDEALKGVAETIIGKAIDITHMRGIAMASTADMEVRLDNALERIFSPPELEERLISVRDETFGKIEESNEQIRNNFYKYKDNRDISKLIGDRMFTFNDKYRIISRLVRRLPEADKDEKKAEIAVFQKFVEEVIEKRNKLAHVKEEIVDGKTIFKSAKKKNQITIDDNWMKNYRKDLGRHKDVLDTICATIEKEFVP